jgi:peptidoglycan hydrolase-like protein with peptidoglycan-binding domain
MRSIIQPALNTDGVFGAKTQQALINFQKQQQIVADGIVCPKTWNKFGVRTITALPDVMRYSSSN